jgi:hypothetical protein
VKAAHGVEVGGECARVPGLKLLDKTLDVGCNKLLGRLPLLRLCGVFGGRVGGGCGDGGGVHGWLLLLAVALAVAVNGQVAGTYMPNALLAKSGGSKAQWGGVSPTRRARESSDFS